MIKWLKLFFKKTPPIQFLQREDVIDLSNQQLLNMLRSDYISLNSGHMIVTLLLERLTIEKDKERYGSDKMPC